MAKITGTKYKFKKKKYKKIKLPQIIAVLVLIAVAIVSAIYWQLSDGGSTFVDKLVGVNIPAITYPCEVRFIDIGQGDSSLIISDGATILVDGGENNKGKVVVDYLETLKIEKLDMIIATHPHSDHIGGLDVVMESFPTSRVIMPELNDEIVPTTQTFTDFLLAIKNQGIKLEYAKPDDSYVFGKGKITIFAPVEKFDDLNNSSIGFRFDYDNKASFLFTGDMEKKAENAVINDSHISLKADVLKSGHHGSKTSSTKNFFNLIDPQICVISVGNGNSYNLPNDEVIRRYRQNDAQIYRTDANGDIVVGYDSSGYHVTLTRN